MSVGVSHEPSQENPEKKKKRPKRAGYFVHATLTSPQCLEASFDCSIAMGVL